MSGPATGRPARAEPHRPRRRLGRAARARRGARRSAGSPPPTRCSSAGPSSPSSTGSSRPTARSCRAGRHPRHPRRRTCVLGAEPSSRFARPARPSTSSSPHRAGARTSRCSLPPRRPASRSGARSSSPGGCGPRDGRRAVAHRHRHQRQDDHGADARLDPAGRRAAGLQRRQRRHPDARGGAAPRAVRRHRRRAVELPAALVALARPARVGVPQRRPRPRRLARLARRVRRGQGQGLRSNTEIACVYNVAGRAHRRLVEEADVQEGCRAVGFTLGVPALSMLGVVDDVLADRAFVEQRRTAAAELATLDDLRGDAPSPAPHLRRQRAGRGRAGPRPRRAGRRRAGRAARLRARAAPHRRGRRPSTASAASTTPRPPTRTRRGEPRAPSSTSCGWPAACSRAPTSTTSWPAPPSGCAASCSSARPRARSPQALARHAPDVPVVDVDRTDTGAMDLVVRRGPRARARAGDVVLLAPAAASMDMFADYGARGDAFVAAVRRLAAGE